MSLAVVKYSDPCPDSRPSHPAVSAGHRVLPVWRICNLPLGKGALQDRSTRAEGGSSRLIYLWLFLLAAALDILAGARAIPALLHGVLVDPDSYMRLVRLEQGLRLGRLVNIVQRDDSGLPLVIEWSRLFDAIIVALAAPLAPLIGWHRALLAAGVATGPISTGMLGASVGFAIARSTQRQFLWAAAIAVPLLPGIREFSTPGMIHYHIAQIALVALTAGCTLRGAGGHRAWALGAGIAGGFAIWMMPETMPWVLLAEVGLGWAWLFRPTGAAMIANGVGFCVTLAIALALDPPHGGVFMVEFDRLSIVYAALGVAVLATTVCLAILDRMMLSPARRAGLGIAAAVAAFAAWLGSYPAVALGPYAVVSSAQLTQYFHALAETQPVHGIGQGITLLGPGCMALTYVGWKLWRDADTVAAAGAWVLLATGIVLAIALNAQLVIFQQYTAAFAAALLPLALYDASRRFAARPNFAAILRMGCIAGLILLPEAGAMGQHLPNQRRHGAGLPSCGLRHIASLLAPAANHIVLTRPDYVPELLYRSRIIAVGSLYQHGIDAFIGALAAWHAPAGGTVPPLAVTATGAEYVLYCPVGKTDASADSLWTALGEGRTPAWLRLIGEQRESGFRLYQIRR
jgi:hypothetical protein